MKIQYRRTRQEKWRGDLKETIESQEPWAPERAYICVFVKNGLLLYYKKEGTPTTLPETRRKYLETRPFYGPSKIRTGNPMFCMQYSHVTSESKTKNKKNRTKQTNKKVKPQLFQTQLELAVVRPKQTNMTTL